MTHRSTRALLLACLLGCISAFCLLAQDHKDILGKWNMVSETDGGDNVNWTLTVKDSNGELTAVLASEDGEIPAKDFNYADGVLKFKAPYEGEYYNIELKSGAEKLVGTWTGGGNSGKTSGTRSTP